MSLREIEQELIARGYRIKYRRPDDWEIVTYQLERENATMGFRITEQAAHEIISARVLVDRLEKEWG